MSAPTTSDPLVVTTADGTSWWRRAVTQDGRGLYAVAGACNCPPYLMSTLATLAEHGIRGQADALPMPVGPKPQMDADRAKAPWGRGEDGRPLLPMGAHWTDIPELVDQYFSGVQARVDQAQPGSWYVSPTTEASDTVCTQYDGYTRTVGRFTNLLPADLALVLHARSDLRWCLGMIAKLRGRVAELRAERHSTNEALDDAVQALRADRDPSRFTATPAKIDAHLRKILAEDTYLSFQQAIGENALAEAVEDAGVVRASADNDGLYNADWREGWDDAIARVDPDENGPCPSKLVDFPASAPTVEESADRLTRLLAPTQALREDEPEVPALTVFRASHDAIVMGLYTTREAARDHCQKLMERSSVATLEWRPDGEWREGDDGEPGPDEAEELYEYGTHESATWDPTGYVVTPLEVASEYDAEAAE